MSIQFQINQYEGESFITAFIPGEAMPLVTSKSANPQFDRLQALVIEALKGVEPDATEVRDLFSPEKAVAEKFETLSDRVMVNGGRVYFDGAVVDNSVTKQIVRFLAEGEEFAPLVHFMENVADNPNEHSREQLYEWLSRRDFTITEDGYIVGYKGVTSDLRSISIGNEPVFVESAGETTRHTGRIPNPIGAAISMDRALVQHDPSVGCHVGLHVGTWDYASNFSRGTVLEVHVNPRDVVSVPTDCNAAKVRTCRYKVVQTIDAPHSSGLLAVDGENEEFYDEDEEGWDF